MNKRLILFGMVLAVGLCEDGASEFLETVKGRIERIGNKDINDELALYVVKT